MNDPESIPSSNDPGSPKNNGNRSDAPRRTIKIGSQRDVAPSLSQPTGTTISPESGTNRPDTDFPVTEPAIDPSQAAASAEPSASVTNSTSAATDEAMMPHPQAREPLTAKFPPPRLQRVSDELQREIDDALGDISMDALLAGPVAQVRRTQEPEIDGRYRAIVVKVHRDDVFLALPGGYDGVVPLRQLVTVPQPGDALDVIVASWSREDGLYLCRTSGGTVTVADWSDLDEGAVVDVRITGHNAGGLECEVNQIRGFIPMGQVSLYRVEDLSEFVGQRFPCIVTEANPRRGNLILSRRAVLERERESARKDMLASLQPGQVREGVVRSVRDFGAFVDLGGVDGLIHVSKLSWDRIQHANEVVEEGQRVKVRVEKVDPVTGKISLSYRDMVHDPWENIQQRFFEGAIVTGTVTKIADFGAFVRLDAGVEGLIHISELAHHRVTRVDTVVQIGQEVTVKVQSIDPESQRISLSRKAALTAAQQEARAADAEEDAGQDVETPPALTATTPPRPSRPLRGGTERRSGGEQFGLKW